MTVIVFIMIFVFPDRPLEMEYAFVDECPSMAKVQEYLSQHPYNDQIIAFQPACKSIDLGNPL